MLEVKEISKWYGRKLAVDKVTFNLEKGEVLAFIGPNGAGKSTSMRIITGFIQASSGSVLIDGHNIDTEPLKAKAMIGYLPENAPLYESMTVAAFLRFTAEIRGFHGAEKRKRVDEVIETCFLQPVRNQSISTLSKGYRHRTCFAQSILHNPEFLVLDEPTDGLDPNQKREVRNLIKTMGKSKAIVISTHILEEVEAVADRVVLIDQGRKIFDGTPDEFKAKAALTGTVVVDIIVSGSADGIEKKLAGLAGVAKCAVDCRRQEIVSYRLFPENGSSSQEIRVGLFELIGRENWEIDCFDIEKGRLDEVFSTLTMGGKEAE